MKNNKKNVACMLTLLAMSSASFAGILPPPPTHTFGRIGQEITKL